MIGILGFGVTGKSLRKFFEKNDTPYIVIDDRKTGEGIIKTEDALKIIKSLDAIVVSPGIPMDHPIITEARKSRIPLMGELEFTFRNLNPAIPIVAITGTNGKTTTTYLTGEILKASGKRVFVGGNIGKPFVEILMEEIPPDVAVLEISSFQLDKAHLFRANIAVLLNVSTDHTDYYRDYREYFESKMRIFRNQKEGDVAITFVKESIRYIESGVTVLSPGNGIEIGKERIEIAANGRSLSIPLSIIRVPGKHNATNIASAAASSLLLGATDGAILKTVERFDGLQHRLEFVGKVKGVRFFNDSKATNIDAVLRAVESLEGPINLLMGGIMKGGDANDLVPYFGTKVKRLFLFGEGGKLLKETLPSLIPMLLYTTMEEAVKNAISLSEPGDTVLLSPGGSSFDEFRDYKERGNTFKRIVKEWKEGKLS